MINCWIPWRYYLSNCIQEHIFPFWNPYQQLGYPIHADLQGPAWYFESLLLSVFTTQNNIVVQLLYLFYVFLAGVGMYFLSLAFQEKKGVAFLVGLAYMCSGFFVSHVQHFYAIISAAWVPFIILNYYKMYIEKSYWRALYTSVLLFFNLTGGNHTFTILLVYLFIILFIHFAYKAFRNGDKQFLFKIIKLNFIVVITTAILASVVVVAYFQTAGYIARLGGLNYIDAIVCPFSPQSLFSLIAPFATVNEVDFFNTDQSMCNAYCGIVALLFLFYFLVSKKKSIEIIFLVFGALCLLISFGDYTPIYSIVFKYLPFLNLFRFPSYFSYFSWLFLLLLAGNALSNFNLADVQSKRKLNYVLLFSFAALMLLLIFSLTKNNAQTLFFTNSYNTVFDFLSKASFYQSIILQISIQLFFVLLIYVSLNTILNKHFKVILVAIVCVDMFIAVQLNLAYVGYSPTNPIELKAYLSTLPKNFPIPNNSPIIENTEELGQQKGLYRNTSGFHKRISADVFNSYVFKAQAKLIDSFPNLYRSMLSNPLLYLTDKIISESKFDDADTLAINKGNLLFTQENYDVLKSNFASTDTLQIINQVVINNYSPNVITASITSNKAQMLTLLQSNYKGWKAFVDGKETTVYTSNYLTMSVVINSGKHHVQFFYKNNAIIGAAIISYCCFFILLFLFSYHWLVQEKQYAIVSSIWLILLAAIISFYFN
jgi:Bacterial membrane protein YfhO